MSDQGDVNQANSGKGVDGIESTVSTQDREKWTRVLARQSRNAAILSLLGGLIVVFSLWWSYRHLNSATLKLQGIETSIAQKRAELNAKQDRVNRLEQDIGVLSKEKVACSTLLGGVGADALNLAITKHPQAAALVPRIYIRVAAPTQSDLAARIAERLRLAGIPVPGIERGTIDKAPRQTELRYFSHEDEKSIRSIQATLMQSGIQTVARFVSEPLSPVQARRGYFQLWFSSDLGMPLLLMTNAELRDATIKFAGYLHGEDLRMYDLADEVTRSQGRIINFEHPTSEQYQRMEQQLVDSKKMLRDMVNNIGQQDGLQLDQFREVLAKRLGSQAKLPVEFPPIPKDGDVGAANQFFTTSSANLDTLARMLK